MTLPCCYPSLQFYDISKQELDGIRQEDEEVLDYAEALVGDLRERIHAQIRLETIGAIRVKGRLSQEVRFLENRLNRIQRLTNGLAERLSHLIF